MNLYFFDCQFLYIVHIKTRRYIEVYFFAIWHDQGSFITNNKKILHALEIPNCINKS